MSGILETILANQERIFALLTGGTVASGAALTGGPDDDEGGTVVVGDTDNKGVVWNAEMCSSNKKVNADGRWQRRKGVDKAVFDQWHTSQTFNAGMASQPAAAAAGAMQTQMQAAVAPQTQLAAAPMQTAAPQLGGLPPLQAAAAPQPQRLAKPVFPEGHVYTPENLGLIAQYHMQEHGEESLRNMLANLFRANSVTEIGDAYKQTFYQYATFGQAFTPEFCQQLLNRG